MPSVPGKYDQVHNDGHQQDQPEGDPHAFFHFVLMTSTIMHGKQRAASHAEPDHDGSQKCHQCVSAANGSQAPEPSTRPTIIVSVIL